MRRIFYEIVIMRHGALLGLIGVITLTGCLQQRAAPIDDRSGRFFGRDGQYDMQGNELPRYSNDNPADMPQDQDAKYIHDHQQTYGVSAEVGSVSTSDLPPVTSSDLPALEATADNGVLAAQQAADKAAAEARLATETANETASAAVASATADIKASATPTLTPSSAPHFVWPLKGEVIKDFQSNKQEGINIAGRSGEPIRAASDGVVVYAGDKLQGYGNMVILQHAQGYVTTYAHLSDAVVAKDDNVIGGQLIGFVGKSGNVSTPQLHFSLREGTKPLNPSGVLK